MSAEGAIPDRPQDFGLIETLLWTRVDGFVRRAGHYARLKNSASKLGFTFSESSFNEALAQACAEAQTLRLRVKLVLQRDGVFEVSTAPFLPEPADKLWRVGVAERRFDSRDPLLRHKTTRREIYEKALAEARGADEVIFINERDEVCEGARTNIFLGEPGALLTPPLSSGLLPGVLRAELLRQGAAREKVLLLDALGGGFFLGNSLRGLLRARLGD